MRLTAAGQTGLLGKSVVALGDQEKQLLRFIVRRSLRKLTRIFHSCAPHSIQPRPCRRFNEEPYWLSGPLSCTHYFILTTT